MYYTLSAVRELLWKYGRGANDTAVAYADRTAGDTAAFDAQLNQVCAKFFSNCAFRGDTVKAIFPVYENAITLPSTLGTIVGANPLNEDWETIGKPMNVYGQWYTFTGYGEARMDTCSWHGLPDLGDWYATFRDPTSPFYVKAVAEVSETSKTILLRGTDENGRVIYSGASTEGVSLDINYVTPQTTTQVFNNLSLWVKSAATNGVVRLYAIDTDTAEDILIDIITPQKVVSGYRRYRVPDNLDWIEVLATRAYTPLVADNDPVFPSNISALKQGLRALRYEDTSDDERAQTAWALAFDELDKELDRHKGPAQFNPIAFAGDYGTGTTPWII